jgi:hypothetical protein
MLNVFFFLKQKAQHNSRGLTIIHFGANAIRVGSLESRAGIDNFEALHRILKVNPLILKKKTQNPNIK